MYKVTFCVCVCVHREKDDDEGIPSETEEDRKLLETKTKEMRGEQLSFCSFRCYFALFFIVYVYLFFLKLLQLSKIIYHILLIV